MRELGKGPRAHKHLRLSGAKKSRVFFVFPKAHYSILSNPFRLGLGLCSEHSGEREAVFPFKLLVGFMSLTRSFK